VEKHRDIIIERYWDVGFIITQRPKTGYLKKPERKATEVQYV
jgi:hypothetical protein